MYNVVKASSFGSNPKWCFVQREFDLREFVIDNDRILFGPKTKAIVQAFADGYIAGRSSVMEIKI